jgi:hypothetical protein
MVYYLYLTTYFLNAHKMFIGSRINWLPRSGSGNQNYGSADGSERNIYGSGTLPFRPVGLLIFVKISKFYHVTQSLGTTK